MVPLWRLLSPGHDPPERRRQRHDLCRRARREARPQWRGTPRSQVGTVSRRHHAGEDAGRFGDRSTVRQRPAPDHGPLPKQPPGRAPLRRLRRGRVQQGACVAVGRPRGRVHPRHAPGPLGRLSLSHHREGRRRRSHVRGWLAEQPPHGHAPATPLRGERLRGTRRARRVVPQREDGDPLLPPARRPGLGQGRRRGRPAAPPRRVHRLTGEAGQEGHASGVHLPPCRADLHGHQGAAVAERLDDLPRRRRRVQRGGGLRGRGLRV